MQELTFCNQLASFLTRKTGRRGVEDIINSANGHTKRCEPCKASFKSINTNTARDRLWSERSVRPRGITEDNIDWVCAYPHRIKMTFLLGFHYRVSARMIHTTRAWSQKNEHRCIRRQKGRSN